MGKERGGGGWGSGEVGRTKLKRKHYLNFIRYLQRIVRSLFPDLEIGTNVRGRHGMKGERGAPLEIDIFLPKLNLGFEYQVK